MIRSDLVFLDTETTGLEWNSEIWEIYGYRRSAGGANHVIHMYIEHDVANVTLPGKFRKDYELRYEPSSALIRWHAAGVIHEFLTGAHVVGMMPHFDISRIEQLLRDYRPELSPFWHYHLVDVETMMLGYLAGTGQPVHPPWKSDELSRHIGVDPGDYERHTAKGDVAWTMAVYDKIQGQSLT